MAGQCKEVAGQPIEVVAEQWIWKEVAGQCKEMAGLWKEVAGQWKV